MFSSNLFWTSGLSTYQPRSHRISHPPSFCGACLKFSRERRIQPFVSLLTGRGVELCVLTNSSFSNSWAYSLYKKGFFFPTPGFELTSQLQKVSRLSYQLNHRGDRHAQLRRLGGDYLSMRLNCVHLRERTANMETATMLTSLSSSSELELFGQ